MERLSPNFTLDELTASDTAVRHGIKNTPTPQHLANLKQVATAMERVRALFGRAIVISSGYRNPEVNAKVGGVPTSAHALGWAVDFHVAGSSDLEAARKIAEEGKVFGITWDQLIYEKGRCVHISFDPRARFSVLSQPGGPGSPVLQGIVA